MTDLILNNRAYNSEDVFNTCFVEPLKEVGKTIMYNEIHKGYIQNLATLGAIVKLTGAAPTTKELEEITQAIQKLGSLLQGSYHEHYDSLFTELILAQPITHRLLEKRKANPKVKKITAEHRVVMCKNLITWWYHYTAEILTGSYDETEPKLAEEQNIKANPGACFIQRVFKHYFDTPMTNRQLEDLITVTKWKYNSTEYMFPGTTQKGDDFDNEL